jgi:hypothetical protein
MIVGGFAHQKDESKGYAERADKPWRERCHACAVAPRLLELMQQASDAEDSEQ